MGGCASKNKQPKEEAYKPANAPSSQPDFEEIVPEIKADVAASKPLLRANGSAAAADGGDKREYRNSVGPGGVILPNQPPVKDEADPSIPFIDASEDELDDHSTPARSLLSGKLSKAGEVASGVKASVEAAAAAGVQEVSDKAASGAESVQVAVESGKEEVKEKLTEVKTKLEEISPVTVAQVQAVLPGNDSATGGGLLDQVMAEVAPEESATKAGLAVVEQVTVEENSSNGGLVDEVMKSVEDKTANESLVDDVLKDAMPEMVTNDDDSGPPSTIDAVKQKASETLGSAVTFGKEALPSTNAIQETVQNGVSSFESFVEEAKGEFTGFRSSLIGNTEDAPSQEQIAQTSESVGYIYSPHVTGVGFRVGDKYIMTAYNLIRDIIANMATSEQQMFNNKEIWIQFEYIQMGEYEFDNLTRFKFVSMPYTNPDLDVAILELEAHDMKTLPPPLASFTDVSQHGRVEFAGHDDNASKRRDPSCLSSPPTDTEVEAVREWARSKRYPATGFQGLTDPNKLRFQGPLHQSTSGSPGVVVVGKELYVVAVLTKYFPNFYWNLEHEERESIPAGYLLDEAVSTTAVYLNMKEQEHLSELCNNIFGHSVEKQS
ncbi:uncharacterized protein LOC124152776 [Haliotis rufescens]|uniref:uncharacterized protein LOC124152776 n=1 Tax=Haliotis rufescens TaxID=6454 RepID=UPI00201F0A2D|nr:uncharacterized protein LOC124152776 [Haliotis rufescens]XP_046381787.2 uncharacterized protein LOC124152776 [Haliotis rufescens]XP_046381788.2 uncharacterized protein LOC124152776 [Haliotis rufescens]